MHPADSWRPEARRAHALIDVGLAALDRRDPRAAVDAFQEALKWQKGNPDAYYLLARALKELGANAPAHDAAALAHERFPNVEFDETAARSSRTILNQAIMLLDAGEPAEAQAKAMAALETNPWNVPAYYYLAAAFARAGNVAASATVFAKAIDDFPYAYRAASRFGEFQGLVLDSKTTVAYYAALATKMPEVATLLAERGTSLPTVETFRTALERWRHGEIPEPAKTNVLATLAPNHAAGLRRTTRVLLVTPRYVMCSPECDEYNLSFHLDGTAQQVLDRYELHDADSFHTEPTRIARLRSAEEVAAGIAALRDHLARFRPDLVVFEGVFIGGDGAISADDLGALKSEFGFRLATLTPDAGLYLPNYAAYWAPVSDLIVTLTDSPSLDAARPHCPVILFPGTPMDRALIDRLGSKARANEILYVGARKRYRDLLCAHLVEAGLPTKVLFTQQGRETSLRTHDYLALHKEVSIVLNNGLISASEAILTGRIFEAIAAGAVLLQQDFAAMRAHFVPFVHYAPFETCAEMAANARILIQHTEIREELSANALSFYDRNYAAAPFWGALLEKALVSSI